MRTSKIFLLLILSAFAQFSFAQGKAEKEESNKAFEEKNKQFLNWYNADIKDDDKAGVSTEKAYKLLQGKTSKTVVVAVIDGGVDIEHEDLQGQIWTNTKEIPDNGIDDDHNGYIDDVHGWNFLGNAKGENLNEETTEATRLLVKYASKLKGLSEKEITQLTEENPAEYAVLAKVAKKFEKKSKEANMNYERYSKFIENISEAEKTVEKELKTDTYTLKELKKLRSSNDASVAASAKMLYALNKRGFNKKELVDYIKHLETQCKYHYNPKFNGRKKIINDEPENWNDSIYGNNNVAGPDPKHGTFVAGIIAGVRNNGIGVNGIATDVKIMSVRTVPDGDERDKDVARAIRYATDNGAQIINMSFGKDFSPQSNWVYNAIEYAAAHNVLMVHAAGNDAANIDTVPNFPEARYIKNSKAVDSWISVGASTINDNKELPANFSNYGKTFVDLFAPGHQIYSLAPKNKYDVESGTSFAAPVVAGIAALLLSHYPDLSAVQLKAIITKTGINYSDKKVIAPYDEEEGGKKTKTKFGELSITGSLANAFNACKMAESISKK